MGGVSEATKGSASAANIGDGGKAKGKKGGGKSKLTFGNGKSPASKGTGSPNGKGTLKGKGTDAVQQEVKIMATVGDIERLSAQLKKQNVASQGFMQSLSEEAEALRKKHYAKVDSATSVTNLAAALARRRAEARVTVIRWQRRRWQKR